MLMIIKFALQVYYTSPATAPSSASFVIDDESYDLSLGIYFLFVFYLNYHFIIVISRLEG